jgi:uncharacterized cupredoxin-like copper-binding protein
MRMRPIGLAALGATALLAAACGGGGSGEDTATPTPTARAAGQQSPEPAGGGTTVAVAADAGGALRFTTRTLRAKAGRVTFDFDNPAKVPHALAVEGHGLDRSSKVVTGGRAALRVRLEPGRYTFYCPVDSHRQAGMEGTLVVSG